MHGTELSELSGNHTLDAMMKSGKSDETARRLCTLHAGFADYNLRRNISKMYVI